MADPFKAIGVKANDRHGVKLEKPAREKASQKNAALRGKGAEPKKATFKEHKY